MCHRFRDDPCVFFLDIYKSTIDPSYDLVAKSKINYPLLITSSITSEEYLRELEGKLPTFLDPVANQNIGLRSAMPGQMSSMAIL